VNGLPDGVDLTFLTARRLEQLCLGEYQVQLVFDDDVSIDLEGEFSLNGARGGVAAAHLLHVLLGGSVTIAERSGAGDLMLKIGAHELIVHDSNGSYESYTLHKGTEVIVV
jgi:hypothetical protein